MTKAKILERIFIGSVIIFAFCFGAITGMTILSMEIKGQL